MSESLHRILFFCRKACGHFREETATCSWGLLHWANAMRLSRATRLARAGMVAVASTVGGLHIGKCCLKPVTLGVDPVPHRGAILLRIREDPDDSARSDVHHVVDRSAPLRESGQIASQEAETLLASYGSRRNTGVQPQQVSNRACIARAAPRANWSHILDKREQVSTRRRGDGNIQN